MCIGLFPLLYYSSTIPQRMVSLVYGLCVIVLFSASSLYHALKREENEISLWRKLDHTAIFFMIAGTYTAVCFIYLTGTMRWIIISVQWTLVFAGIFFRFFWLKAPRVLYTAIYLIMGWIAILLIRDLFLRMTPEVFLLLFGGGVAYTIGAVFYMLKRPKAVFGFHEIFHLFILVGAFFHYLVVLEGLKG